MVFRFVAFLLSLKSHCNHTPYRGAPLWYDPRLRDPCPLLIQSSTTMAATCTFVCCEEERDTDKAAIGKCFMHFYFGNLRFIF